MRSTPSHGRRLLGVAALLVAGAAGFGIARMTSRPAPPAAPAPAAAAAARPNTLTVPADHLVTMHIAVERAAPGALASDVSATGTVTPTPRGEALVTAQAAGSVVRLTKQLGDAVRAGEVLAQVASRDAAAVTADRSAAAAKLVLARANYQREKRLFDERVSPKQDLDTAEAALRAAEAEARRAQAAAATVHVAGDGRSISVVSPISGRITAQGAQLGAFVQPDTQLFQIADPSQLQIEAAISPADAPRVRPGDPARVVSGGAVMTGVVRSITPALDPRTRSATAVLTLTGGEGGAAPGEAVQVQISPRAGGVVGIVVPDEAVQTVDGREVVFVRTPTGFKVRAVTVSSRSGGRAAIAAGLASGEAIATRNAFLLKAELTKSTAEDE